ncbi:MAG: hypothetical protein DCF21_08280 [Leptolyngbya sp.]|nr:MAG: hypothetical protein DCF21_08280 [Leptolyngbya sp.]
MGKRNHRKTIRTLEIRIQEHREKIDREQQMDFPNPGLIRHWETEIRAFEKGVRQARKRLGR